MSFHSMPLRTALKDPEEASVFEIGSFVSHFYIVDELGAGGMGEVFLAEDSRLNRKVALKRLSESLTQSPDARKRLLQEARTAAQLNHANIAAIHDIVEGGDQSYIVMEFVQGEDLASRLRRGPMLIEEALAIGIQVAEALVCAHSQGIIHRDLKPANLIVTPENKVKVLDFGLAKMPAPVVGQLSDGASTANTSLTAPGMIIGTLPYMSPQQVLGEAPDARNDIYSLGVVLFELLTGKKPFTHPSGVGLAMEILTQSMPAPSAFNPDLPTGINEIIARATARELTQRYSSALELREDLQQLLSITKEARKAGALQPTPPVSCSERQALSKSGWRWAFLPGLILLSLMLYYYGGRLTQIGRRGSALPADGTHPVIAVLPFLNLSANTADEPLCASLAYVLNSNLAAAGGVTMVPYASTLRYRDPQRDVKKIARELGATLLVDGGIQHAGSGIVVPVNLIQAASNTVAWGKSYNGSADDVLALNQQLAEGLVGALQLQPTSVERDRITSLPTGNRDAFADYSQARNFLDREDMPGNLDRAIQLFQSAIAKDQRFALAHAGLGQSYLQKYKRTHDNALVMSARKSMDEALRLDPGRTEIRCALASLLQETGQSADALVELDKVVAMQPRNDEARSLRGDVYLSQGKQEDPVREYEAAIEIRPGYWGHYAKLGYAFLSMGRIKEAIPQFRRITELQPDNAWGFQMLGTAYHSLGDTRQARENYLQTLRISPNAKAYSNIGTLEYEAKNYTEAIRAYEQAIKLDPKNPVAYRNLGDACQKSGDQQKARASYSMAVSFANDMLKVNPKSARTWALLALCEAKLGMRVEAARHAEDALRLGPKDIDVLYKKAVVHSLAGEKQEALDILRQALELGYPVHVARDDDDLAAIRNLPQFEKLFANPR